HRSAVAQGVAEDQRGRGGAPAELKRRAHRRQPPAPAWAEQQRERGRIASEANEPAARPEQLLREEAQRRTADAAVEEDAEQLDVAARHPRTGDDPAAEVGMRYGAVRVHVLRICRPPGQWHRWKWTTAKPLRVGCRVTRAGVTPS